MGRPLQKRGYDVFISYGHADAARVEPIVRLLTLKAGLKIWFDVDGGNAATRSSELLSDAIGNSRAAVFLLSDGWKRSTWCKGEFERSLSEARAEEEFTIVAARLDDAEAPGWFEIAEIIDLRELTPRPIARLLSSLGGRAPRRVDNRDDVYLSAPWSRRTPLTNLAVDALKQPDFAWRLVGDSPSHEYLGPRRVEAVVRTTRGVAGVLPYDPSRPDYNTSPYIVDEARIAITANKPLLLLSEPRVEIPKDLLAAAVRSVTLDPSAEGKAILDDALREFDERMQQEPCDDTGAFIFYGGSLKDRAEGLESVVERSSNMTCIRGERLLGANAQTEIVGLIGRAALVIADVSEGRRNTLIETGIALGSDTQLRLMARNSDSGMPPKKPFMLEGREVLGYGGPEEQLCLCSYFARQFRRRVYFG